MRYIFKILQNWNNPFRRYISPFPAFTSFPYSFVVTKDIADAVDIYINTSSYSLITKVKYTPAGGVEQEDTHYTSYSYNGTISNLEIGTTVTIDCATSYLTVFQLNGETLYPN